MRTSAGLDGRRGESVSRSGMPAPRSRSRDRLGRVLRQGRHLGVGIHSRAPAAAGLTSIRKPSRYAGMEKRNATTWLSRSQSLSLVPPQAIRVFLLTVLAKRAKAVYDRQVIGVDGNAKSVVCVSVHDHSKQCWYAQDPAAQRPTFLLPRARGGAATWRARSAANVCWALAKWHPQEDLRPTANPDYLTLTGANLSSCQCPTNLHRMDGAGIALTSQGWVCSDGGAGASDAERWGSALS